MLRPCFEVTGAVPSPGKVSEFITEQRERKKESKWSLSAISYSWDPKKSFQSSPTLACQAPLSMGFSRKEYWSGYFSRGYISRGYSWPRDWTRVSDTLLTEPPEQRESLLTQRLIFPHSRRAVMFNELLNICPGIGSWFSEEYFDSQTISVEGELLIP